MTLVAAAKAQPVQAMRDAIALGVTAVGHNYVQELRSARASLGASAARWHFIGRELFPFLSVTADRQLDQPMSFFRHA